MESHPSEFKTDLELQRRLQDLKDHSIGTNSIRFRGRGDETKIRETRDRFTTTLARGSGSSSPGTSSDRRARLCRALFHDWIELHGDRVYGDDKAMPSGLAKLGPHRCVVITHQKGRDTKENVKRNSAAPPEGYRKALRLMRLAEKFQLPVISLIDTPARFPASARRNAHFGSDRGESARDDESARADDCDRDREAGPWRARDRRVDRVLILENAYYSVISRKRAPHFVERSPTRGRSGRGPEADCARPDGTGRGG